MGEGPDREPRLAQEHRGKAHAGRPAPLREVVATRPEDRAAGKGLGPPPGQGRPGTGFTVRDVETFNAQCRSST